MIIRDEGTGDLRARGGAFKIHEDGCSVYLESVLATDDLGPQDVCTGSGQAVISVAAGDVYEAGFGMKRDPWPPDSDGHKRDAAHALIVNSSALGKSRRERALSRLASKATICVI